MQTRHTFCEIYFLKHQFIFTDEVLIKQLHTSAQYQYK